MSRYLAIGAIRIQTWIARTARLRLVRGASEALSNVTEPDRVRGWLTEAGWAAGVGLAPDAAHIDGIIPLTIRTAIDEERLVDDVAEDLGRALPGLEWRVWAADGESYLAASRTAVAAQLGGGSEDVIDRIVVPAALGIPYAESCHGCRLEAATHQRTDVDGDPLPLGPDCWVRYCAEVVTALKLSTAKPAKHFEELAKSGGERTPTVGRRDARNHLATIYADGNRVGALFDQVAGLGGAQGRDIARKASEAVDGATEHAFDQAAIEVTGSSTVEGVVKHLLGGDDVLVSVPAPNAWLFVRTLGREFRDDVRSRLHGVGGPALDALIDELSLGIGMVFAHYSHPFAETSDLARKAMKQAKQSVRGRRSAVVWHDLTAEDRPPSYRCLSLDDLIADLDGSWSDAARARVAFLQGTTASGRAQLAAIMRHHADAPPSTTVTEIEVWARRNDNAPLPLVFAGAQLAEDEATQALQGLSDLLSRARWWPEVHAR